jgi:hypothetical protein
MVSKLRESKNLQTGRLCTAYFRVAKQRELKRLQTGRLCAAYFRVAKQRESKRLQTGRLCTSYFKVAKQRESKKVTDRSSLYFLFYGVETIKSGEVNRQVIFLLSVSGCMDALC